MNKFYESEGVLLNDLHLKKRLENVKHKFEKQAQQFARTNTPVNSNFETHPRFCSESDTSLSTTPRIDRSEINFELENLERNKERIKNARRKLHQKQTGIYQSEEQILDVHIEDSYDPTPVNSFSNVMNRSIRYNRNDIRVTSEIRGNYVCKRKNSAPSPNIKYRMDRDEDKIPAKFATQPQSNIIPESIFEKKFKSFVEKSLQTLAEIRILLDKGIEPPDGDEDISRRQLRVKEFSNRFSRNYLYPIVRQIDDLSKFKQPHPSTNQKMLSAYHVIFNGLIAYQNHLPTSIGACSSDKLKSLLKHLMDLCDIHLKLLPKGDENGYMDFIQSFKQNAEVTFLKIENQFTNCKQIVTSLQLSAPHFRTEHKSAKTVKKPKNNLEDRLYMYSTAMVPRKDNLLKRAGDVLGRKKLGIKSRYKTAQFKHRPPTERMKNDVAVVPPLPNCQLLIKKSSSELKKSLIASPINEDNISTMIEMDAKREDDIEGEKKDQVKTEQVNREEIMVKLLQLVLEMTERKNDSCDENVKSTTDEKIANVLKKIKEGCEYELLRETLNELQENKKQHSGSLEFKIIKSSETFLPRSSRSKKEPTVTVTGVKNAKLICIKDDNSIETDCEDKKDDQTEKIIELKPICSGNRTDSDKENKSRNQKSSTSLKIKRSSKSPKCLQMLPKDYALSIIQYKIDFHKHCKTNPMYRKTTKITPWILMDKLSDQILNKALLGVAKEVEISDVVERMYQSELQFC